MLIETRILARLTLSLSESVILFAPVAQWIELSRPKGTIWVRFLVGALISHFSHLYKVIHHYV